MTDRDFPTEISPGEIQFRVPHPSRILYSLGVVSVKFCKIDQ